MSRLVRRLFYAVFLAGGAVALVLCVMAVDRAFGIEVAGVSVLAAPLVVLVMPWWSALVEGDWFLLKLVYPWLAVCGILYLVAQNLRTLER